MATTATITIASDIVSGFGGITETMTLTQAGTTTDIDSTTGFQRRKLSATAAVDLVTMASELIEPKDSVAAKIFIKNIGNGSGSIDKTDGIEMTFDWFANQQDIDISNVLDITNQVSGSRTYIHDNGWT